MENWKPGDIAICINTGRISSLNNPKSKLPALRLHAEYLVNKVTTCECGNVTLDVGLSLSPGSKGTGCQCGATKSPFTGIHWASAVRFKKKDTRKLEEQIAEAVSKEDYETAAELQKQVKV